MGRSAGIGIGTQLLTLALVLFCQGAFGEIYKVVDPKTGRVTYTDNPPPKSVTSDKLEVPEVNTQPAVKPPVETVSKDDTSESSESVDYESLRILQPDHNATIPPGQLNVVVQIKSVPVLQDGHKLQILLDGKVASTKASTTSIVLSDLVRGSHVLKARILDADGEVKKTSKGVTIHVKRASVNFNAP